MTNQHNLTLKSIYLSFESEGYILLSNSQEYKNEKTKLKCKCNKGHLYYTTWASWRRGTRCKQCFIDSQRTPEITIKDDFNRKGYKVLSIEYKNKKCIVHFICPSNHIHYINYQKWKRGQLCGKCAPNKRKTYLDVKQEIELHGFKLLTSNIDDIRWHDTIHFKCGCGNEHHMLLLNIRKNKDTLKCCNDGIFKEEKEIFDYLSFKGFSNIIQNNRSLIKPYELDIIIPDKKLAIEYCGLYWHSEIYGNKKEKYHLNKLKLCNSKGYKLITIFSDEYYHKKEIVFSRINNILDVSTKFKTYARQCNIKVIDNNQSRSFLLNYHLQGTGRSSIKLGAFYNEELVAVMTFSRPSIAKGSKNQDFWEINRFCTHKDYHIPGIASKLLTYFERNFEWTKIISYADRRWSEGNLYYKLGFNLVGETPPNYWYLEPNNYRKRIHRFAFRKKPEESKNKTEWELRQEQGYDRIWDCGSLKFEKVA